MLKNQLQRNFHKSPLKYTALAAYIAPVSGAINFYEPVTEEEFIYSKEYYSELQDLLYVAKAEGRELIRVGRERDGGYIMLDDFSSGGIAYSFGISTDVSWDKDIAARGCDIFMYDHTIDKLPDNDKHFHWFKLGIGGSNPQDDRLKTLEHFIKYNHHEDTRNMILKMDVEGA